MIINVWLEIRDTFEWPAEDPADDNELQAKNRETLAKCADIAVIPGLFKTRTQGPRSWQIYSLQYIVQTIKELEVEIERFKSENSGDTGVMGAWYYDDGEQVKDDNVPLYPIPGSLMNYMPDIVEWDEDGNEISRESATELTDVNLLQGQTPRRFN